jgi:hypothetical protein
MWVICAGPFAGKSEAGDAVRDMRAQAEDLRDLAPRLEIPFEAAYAHMVE